MSLTARQVNLLSVMDREYRTGLELAERLYDDRSPATVSRIHQVAATLIEHELVERTKLYKSDRRAAVHQLVHYRLTELGVAASRAPVK